VAVVPAVRRRRLGAVCCRYQSVLRALSGFDCRLPRHSSPPGISPEPAGDRHRSRSGAQSKSFANATRTASGMTAMCE
jgi:hypothetical protein